MTKKQPAIGTFFLKLHTEARLFQHLKEPGYRKLDRDSAEPGGCVCKSFWGKWKWND
jgi:hypothetical protein